MKKFLMMNSIIYCDIRAPSSNSSRALEENKSEAAYSKDMIEEGKIILPEERFGASKTEEAMIEKINRDNKE